MRNPLVEAWEEKLNAMLRSADRALEDRFGEEYILHPARLPDGATANPQQDGLFRVTATFTPGFGSTLGKGYVLNIDIVSLKEIPAEFREKIEAFAVEWIERQLPDSFPGKDLHVQRDGTIWKITGDLSL